ncbi:uncharacterized protein [Antedon mediterranea]|uniref:uncharacterized protein n=1 Tax=Antedon mediterranea TaxID=105859 RepID=UPI003AF66E42
MVLSVSLACILLYYTLVQQCYVTYANCIIRDNTRCECDLTKKNITELNCKGVTTLVVVYNYTSEWSRGIDLTEFVNLTLYSEGASTWPNGLNLTFTKIVNVNLSGNAFQTIPSVYLPPNLKTLDISKNKIMEVSEKTFTKFIHLQILDISHNDISEISTDAFVGLCKLEQLNLDGNRLTDFTKFAKALKQTPSLTRLSLANNMLETVFILDLNQLQFLNLQNNKISNILVKKCTYEVQNLQQIDFRHNDLKKLPTSIAAALNETELLLSGNPQLKCDCEVLYPIKTRVCKDVNVNLPEQCKKSSIVTIKDTIYSDSNILSSGSSRQETTSGNCNGHKQQPHLRNEVMDICWDVPEDACEEIKDLVSITEEGFLNLSEANHLDISGDYSYKEFHTCHETYLYTITGKVIYNGTVTQEVQTCSPTKSNHCEQENVTSESPDSVLFVLLIFVPVGLCVLVVVAYIRRRKKERQTKSKQKNRPAIQDIHICSQSSAPHTPVKPPSGISSVGVKIQSANSITFVTENGFLLDRKSSTSSLHTKLNTPIPRNGIEAAELHYKFTAVDEDGYLLVTESVTADSLVNGYFTYISNESENEVIVDEYGYVSLYSKIPTIQESNCTLFLRKDQGELGQLVLDENQYVRLIEQDHVYTKLNTTWGLLKFWEKKEKSGPMANCLLKKALSAKKQKTSVNTC